MRIGAAIAVAVAVIAAAVLLVSERGRGLAETHVDKLRVATDMRDALLRQELAMRSAMAPVGDIATARAELESALRDAAGTADHGDESELVRQQAAAYEEYRGRGGDVQGRLASLQRFLAVNDDYREALHDERRADARAASALAVVEIVLLSGLFLGAAAALIRRDRRRQTAVALREAAERDEESRFQSGQRKLSEALQAAAGQGEAHGLLKTYLERSMHGTQVHILNRNNSADRLEPSTPLPEGSPLAVPLTASEPRSCVAVRLSREYERSERAQEVLACDICGRLPGDSVCRPLLVGGEVIGSVLVEAERALPGSDRRRIEESVNAAAPVLANLRNLAIAEIRAATDALTGLPNRRSVDDTIKRMVAQAGRAVSPMAVLLLDLDHFKEINDRFGHEAGDAALAAFGAMLRSQLRTSDFAGRSGGEEFMVLLPDTDRAGALQLAEKLRRSAAAMSVNGIDRQITVSIGVSVFPDDAGDDKTLVRLADRALYAAKQNGRDRVEMVSSAGQPELA
jgi:diguanylate cyclase (GGDEF)-like protein